MISEHFWDRYLWLPPCLAQAWGVFLGQIQASGEARTGPQHGFLTTTPAAIRFDRGS